ncbi:hypothetical protein BHE74_00041117 [Ensete ventricosum]|nr:hypothetical protein BHE74_00041117 [Ensete ventricosum]
MIMSLTGHDCLSCIATNYSIIIPCTMSPSGDISIAYKFSCDELGLRLLHMWPLPTPRRASAISDFFCSLPWQFTFVLPLKVLETTIPFGLLRLAEQHVPCLPPQMHLLDCDSSPIQSPLHPSRSSDVALEHFRAKYPESSIEEDHFAKQPEDANVRMEACQPFDDSTPEE